MAEYISEIFGLGSLAKLPWEVRQMIWELVIGYSELLCDHEDCIRCQCPQELDPDYEGLAVIALDRCFQCEWIARNGLYKGGHNLGNVLKVSGQFSKEISDVHFHDRVLNFFLPATCKEPQTPSSIEVYDKWNNLITEIPHAYLCSDAYHTAGRDAVRHFLTLPWTTFSIIKISIEAPRSPAELLRLWSHIIFIVDILFEAPGLPRIEVYASEKGNRKWSSIGLLKQMASWPTEITGLKNLDLHKTFTMMSDFELLLTPFRRIRQARDARIYQPRTFHDKELEMKCRQLELDMTSSESFGLYQTLSESQSRILVEEDVRTILLDMLLDDLDGPCANTVRLERFLTWSRAYEKSIAYRVSGSSTYRSANWPSGSKPCRGVPAELQWPATRAFKARRKAWASFECLAPNRFPAQWYYLQNLAKVADSDGGASCGRPTALRDLCWRIGQWAPNMQPIQLNVFEWWFVYPTGIPKRSSEEFIHRLKVVTPFLIGF